MEIFKKLDFNEFKLRYKGEIGVNIAWDKLKRVQTGLLMLESGHFLRIPHYKGGNWRDGTPKLTVVGNNPAMVRLPAVEFHGILLLLDGVHRYTEVKPRWVVLDVLYPTDKQRPYFTDLFNKFYT